MEARYCANCGAEVFGKFCSQCGAKYARKNVTMKSLIAVIFETVTNWEQKMLATLKYLFIEPGRVPMAFIHGDRRKYYHPVKFVMFWAGISFFVSSILHDGLSDIDTSGDEIAMKTYALLDKYYSFLWLYLIPFLALGSFLMFKKIEPRFIHHNIILCYLVGINLLICIPGNVIEEYWKSTSIIIDIVNPVIPIVYLVYLLRSYFKQSIWMSILCSALSCLFMIIGISIIMIALYLAYFLLEFW